MYLLYVLKQRLAALLNGSFEDTLLFCSWMFSTIIVAIG